jgi:hypothetical protein
MIGRWKRRGNHLATAKLAVRRHLPWYVLSLLIVGLLAALVGGGYAAFHYGFQQGRQDPGVMAAAQGVSRQAAGLANDLTDTRQRLAALEQQLRVEQTTRESLSHQLQQMQSDNAGMREKISFYESLLTSTDRAPALKLESVQIEPQGPGRYRLRAVLVQGQSSQEPFKGQAEFRLIFDRAGKRSELLWPANRIAITVARFSRVERDAELPADAKLRQVEVRIYAQGETHVRLSRTYDVKG